MNRAADVDDLHPVSRRGLGATTIEELHTGVARRIEQSGKFWISTTELKGKSWFRINPVNFRTRIEHMDQLLALIEAECHSVIHDRGQILGDALAH